MFLAFAYVAIVVASYLSVAVVILGLMFCLLALASKSTNVRIRTRIIVAHVSLWLALVYFVVLGISYLAIFFDASKAFITGILAVSVILSGLTVVRATVQDRLRRILEWSGLVVFVLISLYVAVSISSYVWKQPWHADNYFKNLEALEKAQADPKDDRPWDRAKWVSNQLLSRLANKDTLVAVAISGGGSRAAYFAAAALEQLSRLRMPGRSGPGSSLVSHIDLISAVSGGSVAAAYFAAHAASLTRATDGS